MRILVLMGGDSPEREVSLASGEGIAKGLKSVGHEVIKIDTALGPQQIPDGAQLLPQGIRSLPPKKEELPQSHGKLTIEVIRGFPLSEVDVIFIALHGGQGEDGTIQGLLELAGVPYTGSGVLASALAMNKAIAKTIFQQVGVRTPPWFLIDLREKIKVEKVTRMIEERFGFPAVTKPNNQGSTVGFSIVREREDLERGLRAAGEYSREVLVEKYIPGREITVAILEDKPLPVIEIHPKHGVYDYECKYTTGMSEYTVPAKLPPKVTEEAQKQALLAFKALRCRDYGRVDMRLSPHNEVFCLEVNTLPGMTGTSLVPKAAKAVGIDFPQLVDRIARLALRRDKI